MKRILSFLLVIVVISAMAVPAFATDEAPEEYVLDGFWRFDEHLLSIPDTEDVSFVVWPYTEEYRVFKVGGSPSDEFAFLYYFSSDGQAVEVCNRAYISNWKNSNNRYIRFTEPQTVSADFYFWFTTHAVSNECDGTACTGIDADVNGNCDTCKKPLTRLSRFPSAPTVEGANLQDVIVYDGHTYLYTAFTSDTSYTIEGSIYGSSYRVDTSPAVVVNQYTSYDGVNWSLTDTRTVSSYFPSVTTYDLVNSSFNWYDENGELFFPVPLWEMVERVTQGEMMGLTAETAGTMKVLALCGVGLIALLVVLSLFGRRSLISLKR